MISFTLPGNTIKSSNLLYLELLCQLATEAIKHGEVKGTKVRIEAAGEKDKEEGEEYVRAAIYATGCILWGCFSRDVQLPHTLTQ